MYNSTEKYKERFTGTGKTGFATTLMCLCTLGLAACGEPGSQVRAAKPEAAAPDCYSSVVRSAQSQVVTFIDTSGSVAHTSMQQRTAELSNLAKVLPPGFRLYVFWIDASSFGPDNLAYVGSVPGIVPTGVKPDNPYDRQAVRIWRERQLRRSASILCAQHARSRMIKQLLALVSPDVPAANTDIHGAIYQSAEILAAFDEVATRKLIVLWTDAKDTVHRKLPDSLPGLHGARVIVRSLWGPSLSPAAVMRLRENFTGLMHKFGVASVVLHPMNAIPIETSLQAVGLSTTEWTLKGDAS